MVTTDAVLAVCDCEEATLLSDAKSVDDTTVGVADDASQSESRTMTTGDAAESVTKLSLLSNTASDTAVHGVLFYISIAGKFDLFHESIHVLQGCGYFYCVVRYQCMLVIVYEY